MKIHHIGYLVENLDESIKQFKILGFNKISETVHDSSRKITIVFLESEKIMSNGGGYIIELVQPDNDCNLIGKQLKKLRNTPYHICYECKNIDQKISELENLDWLLVSESAPAPAINNRHVAFLFGAGVGIIELLEEL